jgi:hypothetical protein
VSKRFTSLAALAAVAVTAALGARRVLAERAEADLWREATDDPQAAGPLA